MTDHSYTIDCLATNIDSVGCFMVLVFMFGCVVLLVHIGSLFKIICWLNLAQFAQVFSARECISVHPDMQWALCLFLICNGLGCPVWAMVRVDPTDNAPAVVATTHTLFAVGEDGSLLWPMGS